MAWRISIFGAAHNRLVSALRMREVIDFAIKRTWRSLHPKSVGRDRSKTELGVKRDRRGVDVDDL